MEAAQRHIECTADTRKATKPENIQKESREKIGEKDIKASDKVENQNQQEESIGNQIRYFSKKTI